MKRINLIKSRREIREKSIKTENQRIRQIKVGIGSLESNWKSNPKLLYRKKETEFEEQNKSQMRETLNRRKMKTRKVDYLRQSQYRMKSPASMDKNKLLEDSYKVQTLP
jgi:hypothetical protein